MIPLLAALTQPQVRQGKKGCRKPARKWHDLLIRPRQQQLHEGL